MGSCDKDTMLRTHYLGFLFLLFFTGETIAQALLTVGCPACVSVDPLPGDGPDTLLGIYNFKAESDECSGGCSYFREDDQDTVYCFGPGDRTATLECAAANQAVTSPA